MFNFFVVNKNIIIIVSFIPVFAIVGLLYHFASQIFSDVNVYFSIASSIVQGLLGLVAFLGTVIVFKIQLEDQALQKLSDSVEPVLAHIHGNRVAALTPTQMLNECIDTLTSLDPKYPHREFIIMIRSKMEETLASRREVRSKMVDFAVVSFLNVALAIIVILFTPVLATYWCIGGILLTSNILFSFFALYTALKTVRRAMGYDFKLSL